jgi:hypothetical protein
MAQPDDDFPTTISSETVDAPETGFMTRRTRNILIVLAIVTALVATEVTLNLWKGAEACVQVENLGDQPIENLVLTCGKSRAAVPSVAPGASVNLYLAGNSPSTLLISFRQKGNAMTGFQVQKFNPAELAREEFKLVLRVRTNEIERFQDDFVPVSPLGNLVHNLKNWFWDVISLAP